MTKLIGVVETAKLVRKELKKAFPNQKFSVKSSKYSGGSSIDVDWRDGAAYNKVEAVAGHFKGSNFDGMQDMKISNGQPYCNDFIFFHRDISDVFVQMECARIANEHGMDIEITESTMQKMYYEFGNRSLYTMAREQLRNIDLPVYEIPKKANKPVESPYPNHDFVPIIKTKTRKGGTRYWTYFRLVKRPISKAEVDILVKEGRADIMEE